MSCTSIKWSILAAAFVAGPALSVAPPARADTISYTVSALAPTSYPGPHAPPAGAPHLVDGLGYPGDAVGFASYSGTLNLTPGTSVQQINSLNWSISYTYNGTDDSLANDSPEGGDWPDLNFALNAARTMSFGGGPAGSISQTGLLTTTWDNDYLSLDAGVTSTFFVPGYQIDVTPLAVAQIAGSNFDGDPAWIQPAQDVMAQFVVTARPEVTNSNTVPEPASLSVLAMGAVGLLLRRRRKA